VLILLKSTGVPEGMDLADAGRAGIIDPCIADIVQRAGLSVRLVNLH
jgi:hypothetical protein